MGFRHLSNARGFFSDYYLGSVYGRGGGRGRRRKLSDRDTDIAYRRFKRIWQRAEGRCADAPACRERFVRPLLSEVLGLHLGAGEERLHPLYADATAEARGDMPLLIAYSGGWDEDLDAGRGNLRPTARVEKALASRGISYGLLIGGQRMRLVRAPGDGPRGAYLEAALDRLAEDDDPESFAAFLGLYSGRTFTADSHGAVPIAVIERESRQHAERVSRDLKDAVFRSAETLVASLIADARGRGALAQNVPPPGDVVVGYRDAALTALYRMLFILYAEARDPRLDEHALYRASYSLQGALDEVLREPSRAWPENRCSLWARLKALFRIYDEGLPAITPWENLPPRGGDFFDSETPAGKTLDAASLPDAAVARLLRDLATTAPQPGVGRERVSFRELDIENLGSVYEGLLEFDPRVAGETTFEVRVQGKLFALSAAELARLCEERSLALQGDLALVSGTPIEALHPEAIEDDEGEADGPDEDAEGVEDDGEVAGIAKGASAKLIRRLEPGQFHFVPSAARKGSGSFYTPLELVRDLVRHTLGPLVEGREAAQIECLRVLDPACGSAHFLVEAMRFMGQALHRAYAEAAGGSPPVHFRATKGLGWDADWRISDDDARAANSEARAWCKRRIAERCLFGVDRNPTAVGLAHVALWIESLAGDRPLTFFEHHVRCGNSLVGSWLDRLLTPPIPALGDAPPLLQSDVFLDQVRGQIAGAVRLRRLIDETRPESYLAEGIEPESVAELDHKEGLRRQADATLESAKLLFDIRAAAVFLAEIWPDFFACLTEFSRNGLATYARSRSWWPAFEAVSQRERFFHWELEFPEVLLAADRPGFDAVLGNPPWDKVLPTKQEFYAERDMLVRGLAGDRATRRIAELNRARPELAEQFDRYQARIKAVARFLRRSGDFPLSEARSGAAHEDVSKYFVDRAARLIADGGAAGLVVPSVVYNGDGCVGVRRWLLDEARIERFYGFENRRKFFPIDSRYKFVNLVFRRAQCAEAFTACFMRHDPAELAEPGPKPWEVRITREEVERLSPETSAFLEYRDGRDQEIVRRMHAGRPALGGEGAGAWGADLVSWRDHSCIFNATEDKDLFTDPATNRLYSPERILARVPDDPAELLDAMRERGFWPVFEGKHVDQWLVGRQPIRWWLSVERAERKYGRPPRAEPTLVFRETARNTDERTCIAAVLPGRSAGSHTLTGVVCSQVDPLRAATVLDSLVFDFALRLRTAGTHVSFTYILPVAVPPAEVVSRIPIVATRMAWDKKVHVTGDPGQWPDLWRPNRAVAEAYGLGPDDLAHILRSFPVMARKRPDFLTYLHDQIEGWRRGQPLEGAVYPGAPAAEREPLPMAADRPRQQRD